MRKGGIIMEVKKPAAKPVAPAAKPVAPAAKPVQKPVGKK